MSTTTVRPNFLIITTDQHHPGCFGYAGHPVVRTPNIDALAENPRPTRAIKLAGDEDLWRVRVGDRRIVYRVRDELLQVLVVLVGRRSDIYRRLRDL